MPTVLRVRSYRFHFYSNEGNEPPHIHVDCGEGECKIWLIPVKVADVQNVSPAKTREIERIVIENKDLFIEKYAEFHSK